ncbi:hypothetical protein C6P45_005097 [Maudiozyma exigua]|uniref:Uncharacterized protein n=1 Tax=Maudiozyma exigua TaxID=34358 RepID=A0A9P7BB43_MAUEX|nr:hypothetical protein C6P45_005097 [Kazachstania exigua]
MARYDQLLDDESKSKAATIALLVEEQASKDATHASLKKEFEIEKQVKEERIAILQKQLEESLKTIEKLKEEGHMLREVDSP